MIVIKPTKDGFFNFIGADDYQADKDVDRESTIEWWITDIRSSTSGKSIGSIGRRETYQQVCK